MAVPELTLSTAMAFELLKRDETLEVRLKGSITFAQHRHFRALIDNLARDNTPNVVLNLSRVDHVDAAGLGLLLVAKRAMGTKPVSLNGADGQVARMLNITRFNDLFQAA